MAKIRRISAVAAVLVMVFFVSFGTAKAFNWSFLLKLLEPVAQTFGIYNAINPDNATDANDEHVYVDEDTEYEQVNYTTLEDMPSHWRDFPIVPGWLPERYAFSSGSIYADEDISVVSMFFENGEEYLSLSLSFYDDEENAIAYVYEAYTEDEYSIQVADRPVTYYYNDSGDICAASAISQNIHVYIGGSISAHELEQIIASMN